MALVMKRMVDIYKENEWALRKHFPATHDSKVKLRFITLSSRKNTDVSAVYNNCLGELTPRSDHLLLALDVIKCNYFAYKTTTSPSIASEVQANPTIQFS